MPSSSVTRTSVSSSSVITSATPEPRITVQIQVRVSEVSISTNDRQSVGEEIRQDFADRLNITTDRVSEVILLFIDDNNREVVVGSISFQSRKKRQQPGNDMSTFNAIRVNVETSSRMEESRVQDRINDISNQVKYTISISVKHY